MLQGQTVLIIGFGNIAKELIVRLVGFGVHIMALRRSNGWKSTSGVHIEENCSSNNREDDGDEDSLTLRAEGALSDKGLWPQDTSRLAALADIVIVTCKQDEENKGMINQSFLEECKKGG